ncbi:MAG: hypothetical protein O3A40_09870, partial [Bacteroidetes bacterium]|nr:hypothetical protein [Bacteroidota bacterium]
VSLGYAQEMSSSPKVKNGLFSKFKAVKITIATQSQELSKKGPRAKNKVPQRKRFENGTSSLVTLDQATSKGPRSKNSKPGTKKEPKVATRAAYQEPKSMRPRKRWFH